MKRLFSFAILLLLVLFGGCVGNREFGGPTLEPADGNVQVKRCERFDPYPDPNIGPEIPGSRPKFYETPSPSRCYNTRLNEY